MGERAFALTEHTKLCLLSRGHCELLVISLSHVLSVHRQTERCSCQTKLSCELQPQKPLGYGNSPHACPMMSLPHSRGIHLLGSFVPVVIHLADQDSGQDCTPSPVGISPRVPLGFSLHHAISCQPLACFCPGWVDEPSMLLCYPLLGLIFEVRLDSLLLSGPPGPSPY